MTSSCERRGHASQYCVSKVNPGFDDAELKLPGECSWPKIAGRDKRDGMQRQLLLSLEELQMDERQSGSEDIAAIRSVVESWTAAVRRRDFGGILQNHSSDIVMFDVPPPFQSRGIEAYKKTWDLFFSWSSDPIVFDITEMSITAGKDVAFVVATMRCADLEPRVSVKD